MLKEIPYTDLKPSDEINARSTNREEGVEELAALIKAKGLLQPLVVRPARGKFEITAGGRRYLAIGMLIESGDWPAKQPVPCNVVDEDKKQARETSLIENIGRKAMHPVDEYRVFAEVHAKGADAAEIARRYGITEKAVNQRLALGRLAPEILEAWVEGKVGEDAAMAFTICPDQKQQVAAFKALSKRGRVSDWDVKRYFRKDRPELNDNRVKFVGLERYKAAGGKVVESLFGEGYVEDAKLLAKLVKDRLKEVCEELLADGWSWVALETDLGSAHHGWGTITGKRKYTPAEKARKAELEAELKLLDARIYAAEEADGDDDEARDRAAEIDNLISDIEEAATARGFTDEQKSSSGCVVGIGGITYGKVRNVSQQRLDTKRDKAKAKAKGEEAEPEPAKISEALLVDITALQTQAAAFALEQVPEVAIRAAAAALLIKYHPYGYGESPVRIKAAGMKPSGPHVNDPYDDSEPDEDEDDDKDWEEDEEGVASCGFARAFADIAPAKAANLLAAAMARSLDLRQKKPMRVCRLDVDCLVAALPADAYLEKILELFDPTDYFTRASGKIAIAALTEMGIVPAAMPKGKPDLVALASTWARDKRWLPVELRHPDYELGQAGVGKPRKAKPKRAG